MTFMTLQLINPYKDMKKCYKCKLLLKEEFFCKSKRQKDGLSQLCRKCVSDYKKEYYKKNEDRLKDKARLYRLTPRGREVEKNSWKRNKHKKYISSKKWRERNKEYIKIKNKERYEKDAKAMYEKSKQWREKNPIKISEWSNKSKKKYPYKVKARATLQTKVDSGKIKKLPCEYPNCKHSDRRVEAHHWDYRKPLEVTWFCTRHHAIADKIQKLISNPHHNS